MSDLNRKIKIAVEHGLSHRQAAKTFGVSLRQVQKAVNPEQRKRFDNWAYRISNNPRYKQLHYEATRRWREEHRDEINARKRANYDPTKRKAALERYKAKYGPQYYLRWPSRRGLSA